MGVLRSSGANPSLRRIIRLQVLLSLSGFLDMIFAVSPTLHHCHGTKTQGDLPKLYSLEIPNYDSIILGIFFNQDRRLKNIHVSVMFLLL